MDVCCGTGLMASQLVARGYRVVGVDASATMLARARRLLGPKAVLLQRSLPDLGVEGVFDAAISTFDGLNYLTPAELRTTLVAIARCLRSGGWFVFDVHTDTMMGFTAANPIVRGDSHGHQFAIASAVDLRARTCATTIDVTRTNDGDRFTERHTPVLLHRRAGEVGAVRRGLRRVAVTDEYSRRSRRRVDPASYLDRPPRREGVILPASR